MDDDKTFFKKFQIALRKYGYDIPTTEEELRIFKEIINNNKNFEPSDEFDDPLKIIGRGRIDITINPKLEQDTATIENLARAAREGKDITELVRNYFLKKKK